MASEVGNFAGGRGTGEQVALREVATELAAEASWPAVSMPSAIAHQAERVGEAGDVGRDRRALGVVLHALDERPVDLDHVDGEAAQLLQRREAGAEVVDGDTHAERVQLLELGARSIAGRALDDDRGLGHLQAEAARGQPGAFERLPHRAR